MKFQLSLLAVGSLLGAVFAEERFSLHDLVKRQGGAFIPDSSSTTCAAASKCGTEWCLRPGRGDLCCSEGYACPSTSFCLTKGYCCPLGLDPATCAQNNGVVLPASFNTMTIPAGAAVTGAAGSSAFLSSRSVSSSKSVSGASGTNFTKATTSSAFSRSSTTSARVTQVTGAGNAGQQAAGGIVVALAAMGLFV